MSDAYSQTTGKVSNSEALEYILLGDLRDLLSESLNDETRRWVLAVLDALLDTLPHDRGDKDDADYLSEVLEEYPNWSRQVDDLHREREALFAQLTCLRDEIRRSDEFSEIASLVAYQLRDWMNTLTAQKRHETRLLQMAYTLEVGTGD